ncbi:MAG: hypothetical protein MESAZ_02622 [Saezia sanguinis]
MSSFSKNIGKCTTIRPGHQNGCAGTEIETVMKKQTGVHLPTQRPLSTVDVVIFTVKEDQLQVLLVQRGSADQEPFPGCWALPGGFVNVAQDATLLDCALRKLHEKTGVQAPYLEQVGSWGGAGRDPRGWSATHVYFALVPWQEVQAAAHTNVSDAQWFAAEKCTTMKLAFDHHELFQATLERLRSKVEYTSLPAFLLPEPFTLPQLQHMYEVVLGRPVDKSGFRTRMLAAEFLQEVGTVQSDAPRAPMGYRLQHREAPVYFPRTFSPRGAK